MWASILLNLVASGAVAARILFVSTLRASGHGNSLIGVSMDQLQHKICFTYDATLSLVLLKFFSEALVASKFTSNTNLKHTGSLRLLY